MWFDFLPFFEVSNKAWGRTLLECFHFEKSVKLSKKDWINCYIQARLQSFYFAWSGLIDFNFLKRINLYFLNGVIHEDHNFGCLLFLQSENIYVLKEKFYYYRIRENSITNTNQTTQLPQCVKHIYDAFQDRELAKQYHKQSSVLLMFFEFIEILDKNEIQYREVIEKNFLPFYAEYSVPLLNFNQDPLNILHRLPEIEPYLKKGFKYRHKLKLTNPTKYNMLKPIFSLYDSIKIVERSIRKIVKKNSVKDVYIIVRDVVMWYIVVRILLHLNF